MASSEDDSFVLHDLKVEVVGAAGREDLLRREGRATISS